VRERLFRSGHLSIGYLVRAWWTKPSKSNRPRKEKSTKDFFFKKKKQKTIQEPHSTRDVIHLPFAVPRPRLLFLTHFKGTCGAT
jgi:hypothetical protein